MRPEQKIKRMFEEIINVYDFFNDLFSFLLVRYWRRSAAKLIEKRTGMKILDIGVGTGYLSKNVYESTKNLLYGVDITKKMILKNQSELLKYSDPILGTATDLPFRDGSFDFIVSSFTIRSFKEAGFDKVLKECNRILKDEGKIIFLDTAKPINPFFIAFFQVYFKIINFLGGLYNDPAYKWLTRSIMNLELSYVNEELLKVFKNVRVYALKGGIAFIWESKKLKIME